MTRDTTAHSAGEAAAPSKPSAAGSGSRGGKPAASTRHPADPPRLEQPPEHPTKRGGDVVVDWPPGMAPVLHGQVRDPSASDSSQRRAHIVLDRPTGDFGGFTLEDVQRVVAARTGMFRKCYEKELLYAPGLAGTLLVRVQIAGDGQVQAVDRPDASPGTLRSPEVAQCVIDRIKPLLFPAKGRTATLTYSMTFMEVD